MNFLKLLFSQIYNNKKLLLAFIFFVSVLVSSIFLFFFGNLGPAQHRVPGSDYFNCYQPFAISILQGKGILVKENLDICSPPGYPIILAMIFSLAQFLGINELSLMVVFNMIMVALAAGFLFLIAESIFQKKVALIASFLWLSYPFNLWFIKNPNTEVPFILLLFFGIWLYFFSLKRRQFLFIFLVGVIFGFLVLIRPIGFLLPLLFFLMVFLLTKGERKRIKIFLAAILLIGSLIPIFFWEIGVESATGNFILLASSGTASLVDGLTFALKPGAGGDQVAVSSDVKALIERAKAADLDTISETFQFVYQELINRPIPFLKLIGWKIIRSWYATSQMWWEGKILTVQIMYLLTALIGIGYGIKTQRDKIREIIFLLSIVFYFWGMTVLALSILRYMVPAMAIIIIFSAIAVNILINKMKLFSRVNSSL